MSRKTIKPEENVFEALGFNQREAANLKIRADLLLQLSAIIKRQDFTQKKTAKILGIRQPDVSNLMNGQLGKFTIDKLVNMLASFGQTVEVKVNRLRPV